MTPARPIMQLGWSFHRFLHRVLGARISTAPAAEGRVGTLFLATTGRKSGKVRKTGLFYIEDGESFVVVASNAGSEADPAWWLNLQSRPEAVVEVGSRQVPVRARQALGLEADRLWRRLDEAYPDYARYREKVTRPIPIVILEPNSGNPSPPRVDSG